MIVQQFFVKGLAHSSYLLGGTQKCAIVDPRRDVDIYIDAAQEMGMEITHILETHLHADFVSGHRDLRGKTGSAIYAPKAAGCAFDHMPVGEGDSFEIEELTIKVTETPGHTPEHISYIVTDRGRGEDPVAIFCGDTLFVGDVGRPDLFPGRARELASKLYESLHGKIFTLPDFCEVYPAHGAGSLCGRAMGAKRSSTVGYERKYNHSFGVTDKEEFIRSLTGNMPGAPDHFSRCSAINGGGPALVDQLPVPEAMDVRRCREKVREKNTVVLDIRSYDAFGGQHIPGSYHIDFAGNFATFAGWVIPPESDIVLVALHKGQAEEATVWLRRVGLDRVVGYLDGGMFEWAKAGFPTGHVSQISVDELNAMSAGDQKMIIVDVRAPGEYGGFHIEGSVNIPAPDLRKRHAELDSGVSVVTICSTGHRSSLGASILKQNGFKDVYNVAGGMTAFAAAGFGPECRMCVVPHGPLFPGRGEKI